MPPQTEIFEDIICRKMHSESALHPHQGDDDGCRGALVQSELARINGWKTTFEALPSRLSRMNRQRSLVDSVSNRHPTICILWHTRRPDRAQALLATLHAGDAPQ